MKIVSIVGARPQFVKAAAISRTLRERHTEVLVHTGQHYDYEMSGIFFDGLDIPAPDLNLGVGSGAHGAQTGAMLKAIEDVLVAERPDWLLVYGDTNSTLAGALAASKLFVPVAHVEAGLRSFNRRMPEEVNRVVADHLSNLLLCPSETAARNLAAEGISQDVHVVGDVMLDVLNWATERGLSRPPEVLHRLGLTKPFVLATIHRSENTDDRARLAQILRALDALDEPVVFPVHPRTRPGHPGIELAAEASHQVVRPGGLPRDGDAGGRRAPGADRLRWTAERGLLARRPVPHAARRNGMGGDGERGVECPGRIGCRQDC